MANDRFQIYYQGIYSIEAGTFTSAEALIRLIDEELEPISPAEFIPITERNGTIIQIGMIVFCKVCEFIANQRPESLGIRYVEINLSVAQCMQETLADNLWSVMEEKDIPAHMINLEITETAAANSPETLKKNMNALATKGIKFSLDDYGTGYSNMSAMIDLPFHYVKLDRSIVSAVNDEKDNKAFIALSSTIAMLKNLNMQIIAEGVETYHQVQFLTQMKCDHLQGFYFSQPAAEDEFIQFLKKQNQ